MSPSLTGPPSISKSWPPPAPIVTGSQFFQHEQADIIFTQGKSLLNFSIPADLDRGAGDGHAAVFGFDFSNLGLGYILLWDKGLRVVCFCVIFVRTLIFLIPVYPNPSTGIFTIALPVNSDDINISVIYMYDRELNIKEIKKNTATIQIDLNTISRGTYLLKVSIEGNTYRNKLVIW